MEDNLTIDKSVPAADKREMKLNEEDKFNLVSAAKWAEFICIVMFVCIGLVLAACVFFMLAMGFAGLSSNDLGNSVHVGYLSPAVMWAMMVACIVIYLIYLIPILYLYRFARKTKSAIATGSESEMTESFRNLRSSLKFYGIVVIAGIAFTFLMIIGMLIAAAAGAM